MKRILLFLTLFTVLMPIWAKTSDYVEFTSPWNTGWSPAIPTTAGSSVTNHTKDGYQISVYNCNTANAYSANRFVMPKDKNAYITLPKFDKAVESISVFFSNGNSTNPKLIVKEISGSERQVGTIQVVANDTQEQNLKIDGEVGEQYKLENASSNQITVTTIRVYFAEEKEVGKTDAELSFADDMPSTLVNGESIDVSPYVRNNVNYKGVYEYSVDNTSATLEGSILTAISAGVVNIKVSIPSSNEQFEGSISKEITITDKSSSQTSIEFTSPWNTGWSPAIPTTAGSSVTNHTKDGYQISVYNCNTANAYSANRFVMPKDKNAYITLPKFGKAVEAISVFFCTGNSTNPKLIVKEISGSERQVGTISVVANDTQEQKLMVNGKIGDQYQLLNNSSNQITITTIKIYFAEDSTEEPTPETPELGEIEVKVSDNQTVEDEGEIEIVLGTTFTFTAENASNIKVEVNKAEANGKFENNAYTWTVNEIYEEAVVTVTASLGDDETKTFEFFLTSILPTLGEIKGSYKKGAETVVVTGDEDLIEVPQGVVFTFSSEGATHIEIEGWDAADDEADVELLKSVEGSTITWTPDIMTENWISVTAWYGDYKEQTFKTLDFGLTVTEPEPAEDHIGHTPVAGDQYQLVTSEDDLNENCHYVIAYTDGGKAMSNVTISSGQMQSDEVEIDDNVLTATAITLVFNLTKDDSGNYLWNFVNYTGNNVSKGLGCGNSGTDLQVSEPKSSKVTIAGNGDATIKFVDRESNQIMYRDDYNFKYYSSSNLSSSGYHSIQLYKWIKTEPKPIEYTDFKHDFFNVDVPEGKTLNLFDEDEVIPTTLNFVIDDKDIISISTEGVITALKEGQTDVTVSWIKDDVNHFNASEGVQEFTVTVTEGLTAMFDFTTENAYGMTSTSEGSKYQSDLGEKEIIAEAGKVTLKLNGKYRSWAGSSYDLRIYQDQDNNNPGEMAFYVPDGCILEEIVFVGSNLNRLKESKGDLNGNTWTPGEERLTSVAFTANGGNPYISTAEVSYIVLPTHPQMSETSNVGEIHFLTEKGHDLYYKVELITEEVAPAAVKARVSAEDFHGDFTKSEESVGQVIRIDSTDTNDVHVFSAKALLDAVNREELGDNEQIQITTFACDPETETHKHSITAYYYLDKSGVIVGIDGVAVDSNSEAVYFNTQGVRVANPEKGIFIKVQNGKAVKVVK